MSRSGGVRFFKTFVIGQVAFGVLVGNAVRDHRDFTYSEGFGVPAVEVRHDNGSGDSPIGKTQSPLDQPGLLREPIRNAGSMKLDDNFSAESAEKR